MTPATTSTPTATASASLVNAGSEGYSRRDSALRTTLDSPAERRSTATPGDSTGIERDLSLSSTSTSAGAALTRSILLFMGFMFRRPSKLFRPNRLDTWGGLRQLAISADQNLSPSFVRGIFKLKGGPLALAITLFPPLAINATLGFLLFTSHSLFSLGLARLPFFQRRLSHHPYSADGDDDIAASSTSKDDFMRDPLGALDGDYGDPRPRPRTGYNVPGSDSDGDGDGDGGEEEEITFETLIRGPRVIPKHPTLLSALAGAGAGLVQGMAFTPIENVVRFLQQSTTASTALIARYLHLPTPHLPPSLGLPPHSSAATPSSPLEALRTLLASTTWRKSSSWWSGWRWAVGRDALSYSVFFAAFDVTRRVGLRVKAVCIAVDHTHADPTEHSQRPDQISAPIQVAALTAPSETPTRARLAQAGTIVTGGVLAAYLADLAGRPFRACQRISTHAAIERARLVAAGQSQTVPSAYTHPIRHAVKTHGLRVLLRPEGAAHEPRPHVAVSVKNTVTRAATRFAWRVAAVGPWGVGFLVWAWVGGEV